MPEMKLTQNSHFSEFVMPFCHMKTYIKGESVFGNVCSWKHYLKSFKNYIQYLSPEQMHSPQAEIYSNAEWSATTEEFQGHKCSTVLRNRLCRQVSEDKQYKLFTSLWGNIRSSATYLYRKQENRQIKHAGACF